jgi:hypothetical protein
MPSTLTEAAKAIRADIKAAVKDGTLPPYPEGVTFRVRSVRASLMAAIEITAVGVPRSWAHTGGGLAVSRPSPASLILCDALTRIAARHYRADGQTSFISADFEYEED